MVEVNYPQLWQEEYGPQALNKRLGLNQPLSDNHPNPMFRPTVQKLYQKLWGMKILHDQENRVHILQRLGVELDPPHLAKLIHQLQGRLYFKLGYIDAAGQRDWPILHFGDAKWPWQWGEEPEVESAGPTELLAPDLTARMAGGALEVVGTDLSLMQIDLAAAVKNKMLDVIKEHIQFRMQEEVTNSICKCGKEFNTSTAWAYHLRVRIWKEMIISANEDTVP